MEEQLTKCLNCEEPYNRDFNFCPYCGQRTDDKITLKNLFYNTVTNYFSFDARFFKSFIPLIFRPGYLPRKFVEGKRLLYLHPAQMYLFISVIFFFLFSFIERDQVSELNSQIQKGGKSKIFSSTDSTSSEIDSSTTAILDSLKRAGILNSKRGEKFTENIILNIKDSPGSDGANNLQETNIDSLNKTEESNDFFGNLNVNFKKVDSLIENGATDKEIYQYMGMKEDDGYFKRKIYVQFLKFYKNMDAGSILRTFYSAIPIAMFFLLPIFALIVYLLYIGKGRFTHHLIFSFYYFSYLFAVFAIVVGINLWYDIADWIDWLIVLSTYFYLFLALKHFYQQGWFLTFIKSGLLSFLFLMIVLPLAAGMVLTYALLFF